MVFIAVSNPSPISPAMLAKQIGANIQAARKAKGWSLEKLAAKVHPATSYQQLSRLEKGDRTLSVQWVERIAKALGMEPVDLITGQRPPPAFTMDEQVAGEVAQMLATVALDGAEPSPDTVLVLSQILQELTETFSKYPQAFRDPAVARPVVDFAARRFGPSTK